MNCYSFLGHEYSFLNAIVSGLIALKILKNQNCLDLLALKSRTGLCFRSQVAKTITLRSFFPL